MFSASCVLLCVAGVLSYKDVISYKNPWDPFRRSNIECEMCDNGKCLITNEARCEYYAEASKILHNDDDDVEGDEVQHDGDKVDMMLFELVDTASSTSMFGSCIPFISQYTECTEDKICLGCKFCTCNYEGRWICKEKQQCRPELKLNIDHRVIEIVIENLKKIGKPRNIRNKRSAALIKTSKNINDRLIDNDISKWLFGGEVEPQNFMEKAIGASTTTIDTATYKSLNDVDLLDFNDILESWKIESTPEKSITEINVSKFVNRPIGSKNDISEYIDYDPIRLIKRDTSLQTNESQPKPEINFTNENLSYTEVLNDALYGLYKITNEKQKELEELLKIQENLVKIAEAHNTTLNINSTAARENTDKHHISIYNLDIFEKCVTKLKFDMHNALEDMIKSVFFMNTTNFSSDLKVIMTLIKNYFSQEQNKNADEKINTQSYQNNNQDLRRYLIPPTFINRQAFNPLIHLSNILSEINEISTNPQYNPLSTLSHHVRKILKRVIKEIYLNNFATIDVVLHETYNDFDSYLENVGFKWNKMTQDIANSPNSEKIYRTKLLHLTLKSDIGKLEDMIALLEFARNRRMTIANGAIIEKSVLRIKTNLNMIDNKVQELLKLRNTSMNMRQSANFQEVTPPKKLSMLQKLKKVFQNSRSDIKNMLRKKFTKSEIIKQIAKQKVDELEKQRMLEYQDTMKRWEDNLKSGTGRIKRSAWGFQTIIDRIKSIIPGYLKKKVKPAMNSRKRSNKTQSPTKHGREKKKHTKYSTLKTTTLTPISNGTKH